MSKPKVLILHCSIKECKNVVTYEVLNTNKKTERWICLSCYKELKKEWKISDAICRSFTTEQTMDIIDRMVAVAEKWEKKKH